VVRFWDTKAKLNPDASPHSWRVGIRHQVLHGFGGGLGAGLRFVSGKARRNHPAARGPLGLAPSWGSAERDLTRLERQYEGHLSHTARAAEDGSEGLTSALPLAEELQGLAVIANFPEDRGGKRLLAKLPIFGESPPELRLVDGGEFVTQFQFPARRAEIFSSEPVGWIRPQKEAWMAWWRIFEGRAFVALVSRKALSQAVSQHWKA
jgi:hypothetical protein